MKEHCPSEVIYQAYPSSFNNSTGSGLGDLKGIMEKLDYIQSLGVEAVWVSPFFNARRPGWRWWLRHYRLS
jgi:glycosidase